MKDPLALMNIQAEVLYIHDSRGRITSINEHSRHPAPRLFWGQTRQGSVLRFRSDVPDAIVDRIVHTSSNGGASSQMASIMDALQRHESIRSMWLGPAYVFAASAAEAAVAARDGVVCAGSSQPPESHACNGAVKVTDDNRAYLKDSFKELWTDVLHREPCYMMIEDEKAVSVCFSARATSQAAEAGVETLEGYRGKGHAIAVATAWSEAVRQSGRIPLYSTSWDNYDSQSLAERLKVTQYGTDFSFY
ncbi:hypothetical protein PAECIP111893_01194 [Paenibacillus plantiphilus]|uniref:GNAT acetyltransferase n=1 Tax=Paenibacillus plantiphilus TaxID=2905650 RepID=A0ABM9BZ65_9BACL|nr:GNAT family N-acetyltransferase [Paenibacillus plantiphilus]CAH1198971.1 hypothetical protein PAECIP111893_01194 [Paenibacillus plantiphilus]